MGTKHYISYKRYEESHGIGEFAPKRGYVSQEILDAAADEQRDKGWTRQLRRRNLCNTCFTYKTKSQTCLCDS